MMNRILATLPLLLLFLSPLLFAADLTIKTGDACSFFLSSEYKPSKTASEESRDFLLHAFEKKPSDSKYAHIEDLSSNVAKVKTPDVFLNAYLDVLEIGGSATFKLPKGRVSTSSKQKITFFDWLKLRSESGEFTIERTGDDFIRLTKVKDGDVRFNYLKRNLLGNFVESTDRPMPFKERFAIHEGDIDAKASTPFHDAYMLGWGDSGVVHRYVSKSNPKKTYVRKLYVGFFGVLQKIFEMRGLRLLQNASEMFPSHGVSVVKVKATFFNRVYLEDTRGVSYSDIIQGKVKLTESELNYLRERMSAFENTIDKYMKYRFPLTDPEKLDIAESIRYLKDAEPNLTPEEMYAKAKKWHAESAHPGKWGSTVEINFTLNPLSPGFVFPLVVNVSPRQVIVNPKTLHMTIIDPQ